MHQHERWLYCSLSSRIVSNFLNAFSWKWILDSSSWIFKFCSLYLSSNFKITPSWNLQRSSSKDWMVTRGLIRSSKYSRTSAVIYIFTPLEFDRLMTIQKPCDYTIWKQKYILFHKIIFVNKYLLKNHFYGIFPKRFNNWTYSNQYNPIWCCSFKLYSKNMVY